MLKNLLSKEFKLRSGKEPPRMLSSYLTQEKIMSMKRTKSQKLNVRIGKWLSFSKKGSAPWRDFCLSKADKYAREKAELTGWFDEDRKKV